MPYVRSEEVVRSALRAAANGVPDAENAATHGVVVKTIRRWKVLYGTLQQPRGQNQTTAACPRCDDAELDTRSYAELFGWYLGDGWISRQRRGVSGLHVVNDAKYVKANERLKDLMRAVKPHSLPHARRAPGCLITTVSWKHWPCLFPQHGAGRKHERRLGMQPWQWAIVEAYPGDFLRGLFHSDGCLSQNTVYKDLLAGRKSYLYPRWQFSNASEEILGWCGDALDLVDVAWRRSNTRVISVSRRADVARLTALIGEKA